MFMQDILVAWVKYMLNVTVFVFKLFIVALSYFFRGSQSIFWQFTKKIRNSYLDLRVYLGSNLFWQKSSLHKIIVFYHVWGTVSFCIVNIQPTPVYSTASSGRRRHIVILHCGSVQCNVVEGTVQFFTAVQCTVVEGTL